MPLFLVTGGAGFIGSHIVRRLLDLGEQVRVLDDCSTGRLENLSDVAGRIEFIRGSIVDPAVVSRAMADVEFCTHQAAIPSVPRSVKDPAQTHHANVTGTMNVLLAARDAGVRRVVMASSSSVYGNAARYPVDESLQPAPISPYAVSKTAAEMYARVFSELYEIDVVALRYFNVFGPRQDPDSAYSAVIPRFITRMRSGLPPRIFGDGRQTRDFTYVDNVVAANIKACFAPGRISGVYNVAGGQPHSLLDLVSGLNQLLNARIKPEHIEARPGDVRQSHADTARAERAFGYRMEVGLTEGLRRTLRYFEAAIPLPAADPAPIEAD